MNERSADMNPGKKAQIILEDGSIFEGKSFGYEGSTAGEIVFNTAMTGYPESLTDPSYRGQILVSTFPLIGNYGVPGRQSKNGLLQHYESDHIQIRGLIISDYSFKYNHWNAEKSLQNWLIEYKIPGVYGIDTRELTKVLREKGTMLGKIIVDGDVDFYDPSTDNLVSEVSVKERQVFGSGQFKIALADYGVKNNIIRHLLERDTTVTRLPWDADFNKEDVDGIFLTNGPGDPKMYREAIGHIGNAMENDVPIFGICLGSQLMALASGADTYKLKYGHRSHNQPVQRIGGPRCYITSQNHGYAVDGDSLQENWEVLYKNLNDESVEGIKHRDKPFFATQFHPEASGGPTDTAFLFDDFLNLVKKYKNKS